MIEYIQGYLSQRNPTHVIVENNGVGYLLHITLHTYEKLQDLKEVQLFTHLHLKHEGQNLSAYDLYGFAEPQERATFRMLLSVNGIGAGTARIMLSSLSPAEIQHAVLAGDLATIKGVKGIGPKTAQRVILELKDKFGKASIQVGEIPLSGGNTSRTEALTALVSLGFTQAAAEKALQKVISGNPDTNHRVEELIKESLKIL